MDAALEQLEALLREGRYPELERASRALLSERRFYLWHLYLIVALLRMGRRDRAEAELDDLFSYKFNIEARAWPEIKAAFPEKFGGHYILSTMKPEVSLEAGAPMARRWSVPCPLEARADFEAALDALVSESVPVLPVRPRQETRVATFGSCFAANLAKVLRASGIAASNLLIEESINSPLANRAFLASLAEPAASADTPRIAATFGAGFLDEARARLAEADVIVFTLGVAPSFHHADTHRFAFLENYRELLAAGRVYMRTPSTGEVKEVLREILALLRRINGRARIYLSVSPIPLMGTAEMPSAIVADCVSKSTLRAALHEVLAEDRMPEVHYWPSFEIVRWLGGHTSLPIYGGDDGNSRHASDWVVERIVHRFVEHLFGPARPGA